MVVRRSMAENRRTSVSSMIVESFWYMQDLIVVLINEKDTKEGEKERHKAKNRQERRRPAMLWVTRKTFLWCAPVVNGRIMMVEPWLSTIGESKA